MLNFVADLLKEYPALAVAKERLALFEDHLKEAEADKAELEKEVARLREDNAALRGQIVTQNAASRFTEHSSAFWKRDRDGRYEAIAYCPKCQLGMEQIKHGNVADKVVCSLCKFTAPFKTYRVAMIAAELNSTPPA
jgi:hypothetical protein